MLSYFEFFGSLYHHQHFEGFKLIDVETSFLLYGVWSLGTITFFILIVIRTYLDPNYFVQLLSISCTIPFNVGASLPYKEIWLSSFLTCLVFMIIFGQFCDQFLFIFCIFYVHNIVLFLSSLAHSLSSVHLQTSICIRFRL